MTDQLKASRAAIKARIREWEKILAKESDPTAIQICEGTIVLLKELLEKCRKTS